MKNLLQTSAKSLLLLGLTCSMLPSYAQSPSESLKAYWYAGDAELTSYDLKQARYGEIHEGTSVMVYVTEPFLAKEQIKADSHKDDNISVLKLNSTKKFLTGVYPYSIMSSTYTPMSAVSAQDHAIKVSMSMQEWCGHVFTQLNNREKFDVNQYSYFESEGDQKFSLGKNHLENEIWTKIRLNSKELPVGDIQMIPSFEFVRLLHKPLKAYSAKATLKDNGAVSTYTIEYPTLKRTISIDFSNEFPHIVQGWQETYKSGFDHKAKVITSSGKIKKTIKSKYWSKHNNIDMALRKELDL